MPLFVTVSFMFSLYLHAIEYPASVSPGGGSVALENRRLTLENRVLRGRWTIKNNRVDSFSMTSRHTDQALYLKKGHLPCIIMEDKTALELAEHLPSSALRCENSGFAAAFKHTPSTLSVTWSARLKGNSNGIVQTLTMTARRDVKIREILFLEADMEDAEQVGRVDGSVVVCGDIFLAVEHPLAENTVDGDCHVRCALPRGTVLESGETWECTLVTGVVPPEQLRRGFLYYLEKRRAHPCRPFLHYNSWYHLNIGRPDNHMTEEECLETVAFFGRELVEKRGVEMDAFVWDDGWDDFNSLWGFHRDFPDGFKNLKKAAERYDAAQGVWMSPWGGYGSPKKKRIAYGKSKGYETNRNGFSMAGERYSAAFRDVCLSMMRQNGVVFFKFDGMGSAGGRGASDEFADDIDALLDVTRILRRENPDVFISATTGTWASPFWTLFADSIWRQGGDTSFYGAGNSRQRWITYRDMFCYRCIVRWGPLYPLNSLMLHGPCIGERGNPARMSRDEKSVADEIWTFFGSGTNLQELYISPHLLTPAMWDELASAAKWSRKHFDVLVDTHWIGGDPGSGDVYGWASWQPGGGIIVLRNPSERPKHFDLELARDLELPGRYMTDFRLSSPRPKQRTGQLKAASVKPLRIPLKPFEVLVFEAAPIPGAETYDAEAYRKKRAQQRRARIKAAQKIFSGGSIWQYVHKGRTYRRRFSADGTAHLSIDGEPSGAWKGFTWRSEGRWLFIEKPDGGIESHYLDDRGRLVLPAGLGTARKVEEKGSAPRPE